MSRLLRVPIERTRCNSLAKDFLMQFISARQPARAESGAIDLLVTFPGLGEVPFTASPDDIEPHGRQIYARAIAGDFGPIAPYTPRARPPREIRDEKRCQRSATVNALTVTTASGKVFNADEESQNRMVRVLKVADLTGQTSCAWVLADDAVATVTKTELEEALSLAVQAMGAIWATPYQE